MEMEILKSNINLLLLSGQTIIIRKNKILKSKRLN